MSAIAHVLLALHYQVSGSDMKESTNTIRLKELGAKINIGHETINIRDAQIIVYSSAIKEDNPEIKEARALNLPVFGRAQMLGYLMSLYQDSIAVAGTHGKTTTSSMMAVVLAHAGLDPTFMIGGEVTNLKSNGNYGASRYFVAEADESDGSITHLNPQYFILTNIEKDHMDHFGSLDDIIALFETCALRLAEKPNHLLVINSEQWGNAMLLQRLEGKPINILSYGLDEKAQLRATNIRYKGKGSSFSVIKNGVLLGDIELSIPGEHNVVNALAVIGVSQHLGLDFLKIKLALKTFTGAKRRFTLVGKAAGISVYDDYAHHPTEIAATLRAARLVYPKARLICAFQPHRYSRTLCFLPEFAESLNLADKIILTSIYGAGEKPIDGVNAEMIAQKIPADKVTYIDKKDDIADFLEKELLEGDVFFTLGAGDIYTVGKEILNRKKNQAKSHADNLLRIA